MAWPEVRDTNDGKRWYPFDRIRGDKRKFSLKTGGFVTRKQCQDHCDDVNSAKRHGTFNMPGAGPTLKQAIDEFLVARHVKENTRLHYRTNLKLMLEHFGPTIKISKITRIDMLKFRDKLLMTPRKRRAGNYSKNGVRIVMAGCRAMFGFWIDEREELKTNPCHKILKKFKEEDVWRALSWDEVKMLARACLDNPELWDIITFALGTGLRIGAIMNVRREDFLDGRLRSKWKTEKMQYSPIREELRPMIERVPAGRIFPGWSVGRVEQAFSRAVKRSGIVGRVRFHDLRHTFATDYMTHVRGANLRELQELLNHQTLSMTGRYAHIERNHLERKVNEMPRLVTLDHLGTIWADSPKQGAIPHIVGQLENGANGTTPPVV